MIYFIFGGVVVIGFWILFSLFWFWVLYVECFFEKIFDMFMIFLFEYFEVIWILIISNILCFLCIKFLLKMVIYYV